MISIKINKSEIDNIWLEGYSGVLPQKINRDGSGIGLFIIPKLLERIGGTIELLKNKKPWLSTSRSGIEFEHNVFKVNVPIK